MVFNQLSSALLSPVRGHATLQAEETAPEQKPEAAPRVEQQPGAGPAAEVPKPTPPSFPLPPAFFEGVRDSYEEPQEAMIIERGALEEILRALKNTDPARLEAALEPDVTFFKLMKNPDAYRGHVVRARGILWQVDEVNVPPNRAGCTKLWHCYISNARGDITNVVCLEPPPDNVKMQKPVQVAGVFLKRYLYENKMPGGKGTWGPMVFSPRLLPVPKYAEPESITSIMNSPVAIALFSAVALSLVAYAYYYIRQRAARQNYFTQKRREKEGTGLFPGSKRRPGT
jgi:hypothetical protein